MTKRHRPTKTMTEEQALRMRVARAYDAMARFCKPPKGIAAHAFASVVDDDLAARRHRLALRMTQARQSLADGQREASARHAAFWATVEAQRAADAAVTRVGGKA